MHPTPPKGYRWVREVGEEDIKRVMQDPHKEIIDWPEVLNGKSFVLSRRLLIILRTGGLGGDVRNIDGGWLYPNDIAFMLERREILIVRDGTHTP